MKYGEKRDAVVVGGGLSGLGIGALLSSAGEKVMLIESLPWIGGRARTYERDGFIIDNGPHLGVKNGRYDNLLKAVGKSFGQERYGVIEGTVRPIDGKLVDFSNTIKWDQPEIKRCFDIISGIEEKDLVYYDSISLRDWAQEITNDPDLLFYIENIGIVASTIDNWDEIPTSLFFREVKEIGAKLAGGGIQYPHGGWSEKMDLLREAIEEKGGKIKTGCRARKIIVENGAVKGVLCESSSSFISGEVGETFFIEAPLVVSAIPIWLIGGLLEPGVLPEWFMEWVARFEGKTTAIVGFWAALREPLYTERYFIGWKSPTTGLPYWAFMLSNISPSVAPEGVHLFNQISQCSGRLIHNWNELLKVVDGLKKDTALLFPGWKEKAIWVRPYFFGFEEPRRQVGLYGCHAIGPKAPKIKGLYFAGDSVNSRAATMEGAADSAMICFDAIKKTK